MLRYHTVVGLITALCYEERKERSLLELMALSYVQVGSHEMHAWSRAKLHNGTVTVLPLPDRFGPQTAKKIKTKSIMERGGSCGGGPGDGARGAPPPWPSSAA